MSQQIAPFTGFGGVPFTIMSDSGRITDWHRELVVNEAKVPVSNQTITQVDGFAPWRLEVRLLFASYADWQRFDALRGQRASLTHLAGISAVTPFADYRYQLENDYVTWDGVLYRALREPPRPLRGGRVIATVTFQREGA